MTRPQVANDSYEEYFQKAIKVYGEKSPEWRWGQTLFNVLWTIRPDLCDRVHMANTDGSKDPFYDNTKAAGFLEFIEQHWEEKGV